MFLSRLIENTDQHRKHIKHPDTRIPLCSSTMTPYYCHVVVTIVMSSWFWMMTSTYMLKSCVHMTNSEMPEPAARDAALYGHVFHSMETADPYWCARR